MSHAQPKVEDAYEAKGNAASKEPIESRHAAEHTKASSDDVVEQREPDDLKDQKPKPSPLARGVHGAPPGVQDAKQSDYVLGESEELDAPKMGPPGEGRVRDAVTHKQGASGSQPDLASNLDRKKAEQKPARDKIESERSKGFDVGGILGQRGGPASTE